MATFFITYLKKAHYYFELKTASGKALLRGDNLETREQCEEEVRLVVKYSRKKGSFSRHTTHDGSFYFCLNDKEGLMLASSEEYVTEKGLKKAIRTVRKHVWRAQIERE